MRNGYLHRWKDTPLADANPQAEILHRRILELGILNQIAQALKHQRVLDRALNTTLGQVPLE